jgi:hypothetical protein
MSQAYCNSFFNIGASIVIDSDAGCFCQKASTVMPYLVQTEWTDHPNGTYYLYGKFYWYDDFEHMPEQSRMVPTGTQVGSQGASSLWQSDVLGMLWLEGE